MFNTVSRPYKTILNRAINKELLYVSISSLYHTHTHTLALIKYTNRVLAAAAAYFLFYAEHENQYVIVRLDGVATAALPITTRRIPKESSIII